MPKKKTTKKPKVETPVVEEAPVTPKSEPRVKIKPPVGGALRLSARQFVRGRKIRWERAAAWLYEMKKKLGPNARKTTVEWEPLWNDFWKRPV